MSGWRSSPVVAVLALSACLAVQLAIPLSRIGDDEGGTPRYAWHMFSVSRVDPQFVVVTSEASIPVDLDDYLARVRDDLDFETLVPPHLCHVIPSAEVVVWQTGRFEC